MTKSALKLRPPLRFGPVAASAICLCVAQATLAADNAAGLASAKRFREQVEGADWKTDVALQQVARAEQAKRNAREPLAGERVGNAGGGWPLPVVVSCAGPWSAPRREPARVCAKAHRMCHGMRVG